MKKLIIFLALFYSFSSFATSAGCYHESLGLYHFDSVAFGKKVASVTLRTAALQEYRFQVTGEQTYWHNVTENEMHNNGSNFFAKVQVTGFSGSHAPSRFMGVIAQYLVRFEDGSSMFTEPVKIPVTKTINADQEQNEFNTFEQTQNVEETKTTIVRDCWVG